MLRLLGGLVGRTILLCRRKRRNRQQQDGSPCKQLEVTAVQTYLLCAERWGAFVMQRFGPNIQQHMAGGARGLSAETRRTETRSE